MLLKINHIKWMLLFCVLYAFTAQAQNEISTPYSSYGIGVINHSSNGILDAMGSVSYAMQDPYYINFRNPASYAAFDSLSFAADIAASIYSSKLSQGQMFQKNTYAKPGYIAIGVPVTQHWRTSIGVMPFSDVGYNISEVQHVDNIGDVTYTYSGEGGLNQLYWGNAFKICKGLSIGLNINYMFGSIFAESNTEFEADNYYNSYVWDAYIVNGIYLNTGIQYFFNAGEDHRIGIGAVYSNTAYIWANEKRLVNSYSGQFISTTVYDTILYDEGDRGKLRIPQSFGIGLSYTFKNKMTIAGDFTWENLEKFSFLKPTSNMKNAMIGSLGFQYIPNPLSNKFFHKMAFRVGGKFSTGNLIIHNKPITELGVSVGVGVPLTTFNTHSSINILFEYGKRGTQANDLVQEDYFRFSFCFTLQEKWYQRFKID